MMEITKLRLPVRPNDLPDSASGGWLPLIDGLQNHEIIAHLKEQWSGFQAPYLQSLSDAILSRELQCLSVDPDGHQWLSFDGISLDDPQSALHVAPPATMPVSLRSKFPFQQIPGLAEFLESFGGLSNGRLSPYPGCCPCFTPFEDCRVVTSNCDSYDWGMIGDWAGSLTLYNTRCGNFIVVSPENICAKWEHEIGWDSGGENPFWSLRWTMSEMVEEFIAYLSLADSEAKDSPFYY